MLLDIVQVCCNINQKKFTTLGLVCGVNTKKVSKRFKHLALGSICERARAVYHGASLAGLEGKS